MASSLLESVLALTLISICLYIAIMVYSAVFSPKTSIKFYTDQNKANEFFYIRQIGHDSLTEFFDSKQWEIEEETTENIRQVTLTLKDSLKVAMIKTFFIPDEKDE